MGNGGIRDAAVRNDVVEEGFDELPLLEEVLLDNLLLGTVLVVFLVPFLLLPRGPFRFGRHFQEREKERETCEEREREVSIPASSHRQNLCELCVLAW